MYFYALFLVHACTKRSYESASDIVSAVRKMSIGSLWPMGACGVP